MAQVLPIFGLLAVALCVQSRGPDHEKRKALTMKYSEMYTKACSGTFDRLKGFAEECSKEMDMATEAVEKCRTAAPKKRKPKTPKSKRNETAVSTETPMPEVITISDNESSSKKGDLKIHSWKDVWHYDSKTVNCYVRTLRATEAYKKMSKEEWKETSKKLLMEKLAAKTECLEKKMQ